MISIIICARSNDISRELRQNISETIGVPFEVIVIDNSNNQYSIFSAYNKGIELSSHPLLLFMHDDIFYHTKNWGQKLINHFDDLAIGAVGIAGTPYMPYCTGGWWSCGAGHLYLLQSDKKGGEPVLQNYFPENSVKEEVVALDGVWFCVRREIFDQISFDEKTFGGFHFYDVDISLQVYKLGFELVCVKDILIHHESVGNLDGMWMDNAELFHHKWRKELPLSVRKFAVEEQCIMEYRVLNETISHQLRIGKERGSEIYLAALKNLLGFKKAYRYFKTPYWAGSFLLKYLKAALSKPEKPEKQIVKSN